MFGNLYPKLLRLPQKYHDTEGSLVFISIAKYGSRSYTQSLLFLICTLAGMNFFTLDYQSHNFARWGRQESQSFACELQSAADVNLKVIHQLSAQGSAGVCALLCFYPSSRAVLKKASGSSLANMALLNMYYPTSIFI